jgi:menaquinol-cytochrome c reductase iron-sulfur subunit
MNESNTDPRDPRDANDAQDPLHGRLQLRTHQQGPCAPIDAEDAATISRRGFFEKLCIGLGGVCAVILGVPLVGFIVAPLFRKSPQKWIPVGNANQFEIGKTVNVNFSDPSPLPWAGITAKNAAWLRRQSETEFIAFSVNCTHLGCPVRWMPDAELFLCPCHGGVYYKDGTVAAGPPPHPLIRYNVRVVSGVVQIQSAAIPITTTL